MGWLGRRSGRSGRVESVAPRRAGDAVGGLPTLEFHHLHASFGPWVELRAAHQLIVSAAQVYDASMTALADLADPVDFAALSVQTDLVLEAFVSAVETWRAAVAEHERARRVELLELQASGVRGEASAVAEAECARLVSVARQAGDALYATAEARAELADHLVRVRRSERAARELATAQAPGVCEPALEAQALAELLAEQAAASQEALRALRVSRSLSGPAGAGELGR